MGHVNDKVVIDGIKKWISMPKHMSYISINPLYKFSGSVQYLMMNRKENGSSFWQIQIILENTQFILLPIIMCTKEYLFWVACGYNLCTRMNCHHGFGIFNFFFIVINDLFKYQFYNGSYIFFLSLARECYITFFIFNIWSCQCVRMTWRWICPWLSSSPGSIASTAAKLLPWISTHSCSNRQQQQAAPIGLSPSLYILTATSKHRTGTIYILSPFYPIDSSSSSTTPSLLLNRQEPGWAAPRSSRRGCGRRHQHGEAR